MSYDITYVWSLKYVTNELLYTTETEKTNLCLPKGTEGVEKR